MIAIRIHLIAAGSLAIGLLLLSCAPGDRGPGGVHDAHPPIQAAASASAVANPRTRAAGVKVIRVVVALCDNLHQGIVPVPARLGNGDDPESNLYWGAGFGVRSFFGKSPDWRLLGQISNPKAGILRRCIFRHSRGDIYLIADAYQGIEIKQAISDFLDYAAGAGPDASKLPNEAQDLALDGLADLAVYVGHNGLMDFRLPRYPVSRDGSIRDAMVLCCVSKSYFSEALRTSGARPVLLTTGLMAPEAYVLEAAVKGWISGETGNQICARAANAYNKYQKCGYNAAHRLFTPGY